MAVDVTTRTTIARPRDEVAAFACDPDRVPLWYQNIKTVEWKTAPPLAVGTKLAFVALFLGRRLAYTYEVVEHAPGERFVMRTAEGPFPMETTYTWQSTPDGRTEMTLRNRGTPSGFSSLVAPFMAMAMRRANTKDLALLKAILERRAGRRPVA
ncbi:MAG: SRPBCC family protein [Vicinamibacterales bacterium]